MPYVIGTDKDEAEAELDERGLKVDARGGGLRRGRRTGDPHRPGAGTPVGSGATVTVFWSDGPEEVPDVVGLTQERGRAGLMSEAGFEVEVGPPRRHHRAERAQVLGRARGGARPPDRATR